jgi:UDP-N-acetylmuramoyl-tripeptide--D-alanyl-D-alanine ligase
MATAIPTNRAPFTVEEVALATGGQIVRGGAPSIGVCTDSRAITEGVAFVALVGDRFDGHAFLEAAAAHGARTLVVSRGDVASSAAVVRVADTRTALGDLARAHRVRWAKEPDDSGPRWLVAITGSAGKTTTKTVLARLLDAVAKGAVHASAGNLNNDVGVPMTLFGLDVAHRYAVVEVGTNTRGEIEKLSGVALPNVAILTLVAAAHTEGLGSVDDVAVEKGALLESLPADGLAVVNADDPRALGQLPRSRAETKRTFGFSKGADYRIARRETRGRLGARLHIEREAGDVEVDSPLLGDAGALAVAASLAAAEWLIQRPMRTEELRTALAEVLSGGEGRLSLVPLADGTLVIDDSYNANPASMRSSVVTAAELAAHEKRRLLLVLGEMRELGAASKVEHDELGRWIAGYEVAHLVGVGGDAEGIASVLRRYGKNASFAADAEEATVAVLARVEAGDVVLVKGSRSVATERIVRALVEDRGLSPNAARRG